VRVAPNSQNGPPQRPSRSPGLVRYAGMGVEFAGAMIGLTLCGYWIDYHFHTGRIGLITGAVLGVVGGSYNFIRQALALLKEQNPPQGRNANLKGPRADHSDDTTRGN
jgi:F0F1-type ATP synthase assembly protein I